MAKVAYGKLQLTKNTDVKTFEFNGQVIEVTQYLPAEAKMELLERILGASVDDNGYYNVFKINFFTDLEILFTYTNITFTAKQKEDLFKIYDMAKSAGLITMVKDHMNQEELADLITTIWETIKGIYKYQTSALGIIRMLAADYGQLDFDVEELQGKISNPDNLAFLREVLTKMG